MIHIPLHYSPPKSEFWSPSHTVLKRCVHRNPQARLPISHNAPPNLYTVLAPHLGHHPVHPQVGSDTCMRQPQPFGDISSAMFPSAYPFSMNVPPTDGWANSPGGPSRSATSSTSISIPPPVIPFSDHTTTVNAIETYGMPVGIAPSMDQSTAIGFGSNPCNAPIVIEQKRWYDEYGIDRDANGLFHCPFSGCGKENKRRDQLWEHWKAKHNGDPYRCSLWSVL